MGPRPEFSAPWWLTPLLAAVVGCSSHPKAAPAEAAPVPEPAGGLHRVVCLPSVRDHVGNQPEAADAATRQLTDALDRGGRVALRPEEADALLERIRNANPNGAPVGPPTPAELADLGRRAGAELVLYTALVSFKAEGRRSDHGIPLGAPSIPFVPVPVPIPGLGSISVSSTYLRLELGLECRVVDVKSGDTVSIARGFAARDGKRKKVVGDGGENRPYDAVAAEAAADLLARIERGPAGRP